MKNDSDDAQAAPAPSGDEVARTVVARTVVISKALRRLVVAARAAGPQPTRCSCYPDPRDHEPECAARPQPSGGKPTWTVDEDGTPTWDAEGDTWWIEAAELEAQWGVTAEVAEAAERELARIIAANSRPASLCGEQEA